jgi:Myb-like DNA-binding domain
MTEATSRSSGKCHFLPVTARHVMEDVAAWWIRVLLQDSNVNRLQEVLETILPGIIPLSSQSSLAAQLKLLSLWQEVLFHTHLQGDFALLQDKFLLLATDFGKSPASDRCMQLLKVHEVLGAFYESLRKGISATDQLQKSLKALYHNDKGIPAELAVLWQPDGEEDIPSLQAHMEAIVASNGSRECTDLTYDSLRDQIQTILIEWIESAFETPLLVQLGYRMTSEVPSTTTTHASPFISPPIVRRPESTQAIQKSPTTDDENLSRTDTRSIERRPSRGSVRNEDKEDKGQDNDVVSGTANQATLTRQSQPATMNSQLAAEPQTMIAPFQLPERKSTATDGPGSVDSEMTAEASNIDPDLNDKESTARNDNVRIQTPSTGTRQRRRSKYQKEPQEEPQLITQPDSEPAQKTPSKKTDHALPFDDDEDASLEAARHRQKRRHLNPLSPLPSVRTPESNKKRARTASATFEENWSPNATKDATVNSRNRRLIPSEGLKASVASPRRRPKQLTTRKGPTSVASSSVSHSRQGVPNDRIQNLERLRIAALALMQNTKRQPFSEKENAAIMEGVSMYGSDWAAIKKHFMLTLHRRTLLHIKDRARMLIKKGKLDPAWLHQGCTTMEV